MHTSYQSCAKLNMNDIQAGVKRTYIRSKVNTMIRVGIFFGGSSREREVSFAGGRTVYDNLDKNLFEPIPIFVDSFHNFILLDWHFIYKGSIRDFYPPVKFLKESKSGTQIYAESIQEAYLDNGHKMASTIGKIIPTEKLGNYIDFAFLALHGGYGEDGTIQGLLEWQKIPYSGSGILPSALGMHKETQKSWMKPAGFAGPSWHSISREEWINGDRKKIFNKTKTLVGNHFVVKPANQGSSVGVSVVKDGNLNQFIHAVNKSFFINVIEKEKWISLNQNEKSALLRKMADVKEGIAFPVKVNGSVVYHPDDLSTKLTSVFKKNDEAIIEAIYSETECLIESFIAGREFSCIVIRDESGKSIALPPTEIVKGTEVYDYRSKYLPGLSRKVTPIDLPDKKIQEIRDECEKLFEYFKFNVYARIDGFINNEGKIFLNDPNTTSGMMPSSFFFHQAAEIGLNPSQFLTFIISSSINERCKTWPVHYQVKELQKKLSTEIINNKKHQSDKTRVAVMMGGYSTERHISVESGRNIFEKLSSSAKYKPFPVFVTGSDQSHELFLIPINVMLKDNADDIGEKVRNFKRAPIINKIIKECNSVITKFGDESNLFAPTKINYSELAKLADSVFIALHGRPGEDGTVQKELIAKKIPFNGSGVESSQITINKFNTNQKLRDAGFLVADHFLLFENDWNKNQNDCIEKIERIGYPLIAKPVDDGCSSAVKKIKTKEDLKSYAKGVFRKSFEISPSLRAELGLHDKEEFPKKSNFLIERFVEKNKAAHFLEITGGMITHYGKDGKLIYETFEPSEALAEGEILSLEEKFLAGQGQNITPARYHKNPSIRNKISKQVQKVLADGARLLKVEGYCRIDAFVRIDKKNNPEVIFIEINSLPGMTPATAIFHQCALNDYKPFEFIDAILEFGKERNNRLRKVV